MPWCPLVIAFVPSRGRVGLNYLCDGCYRAVRQCVGAVRLQYPPFTHSLHALPHCLVTPLSRNDLVRLGRGSAVRWSSRLVPACTALGDQKYKALSIIEKSKNGQCSRNTTVSAEQKIALKLPFLKMVFNFTPQKGNASIMNYIECVGKVLVV